MLAAGSRRTADTAAELGPGKTEGIVEALGGNKTANLANHIGGEDTGKLVVDMGPEVTADTVKEFGPDLTADIVAVSKDVGKTCLLLLFAVVCGRHVNKCCQKSQLTGLHATVVNMLLLHVQFADVARCRQLYSFL